MPIYQAVATSRTMYFWAYNNGLTNSTSYKSLRQCSIFCRASSRVRNQWAFRHSALGSKCTKIWIAPDWLMPDILCMAEPLVIQSLKDKRAEIHGRIAAYQAQIAQAKHDLAHINASIRLFTDPEHQRARYMVSHGFFKKGEVADICLRHLEIDGEMTTRELAERVMVERNLDATDTTLRNSVVFKVVQALRHAARRKLVRMVEKRKGMCIWVAGDAVTLRVVANSRTTPG